MKKVDLEISIPFDFAKLYLSRICSIKNMTVDVPRTQLLDLCELYREEFVDPFYDFVAGSEVATVHHDVSIIILVIDYYKKFFVGCFNSIESEERCRCIEIESFLTQPYSIQLSLNDTYVHRFL